MQLSIITINYNNKAGLIKTVESVIHQTFHDFEFIIIDGGSTDGSKEYIEQMQEHFDYWVSEPDEGIYNAMNKGIAISKGEYCYFLNSGDWLLETVGLEYLMNSVKNEDIVYTNVKTKNKTRTYPAKLTLMFFFKKTICHQAHIIRRELFHEIGFYKEQYKIIADWEFLVRSLIISKKAYKYIDYDLAFFDDNGISSDRRNYYESKENRKNILRTYFPLMYDDYLELFKAKQDLQVYKNSRLIQRIKNLQKSKFYRFLGKW